MSEAVERWKVRDAELYGELPPHYSSYVARVGGHVVAEIVRLAAPRAGERALDVGAGTGTATVALARALGRDGCVLGIDFSPATCARATLETPAGLAVVYRTMDAEALALDTGSFDLAISFSAIFHFPHPLVALGELARVLRPGGRLVVSHHAHDPPGTAPERRPEDQVAPDALAPFAQRWLAPARHAPVPSWSRSEGGRHLTAWLAEVGFEVTAQTRVHADVEWEDADEYFEAQMMIDADLRTRASEAGPNARARLRREFTAAARAAREAGGRLLHPFGAVCIAARRRGDG